MDRLPIRGIGQAGNLCPAFSGTRRKISDIEQWWRPAKVEQEWKGDFLHLTRQQHDGNPGQTISGWPVARNGLTKAVIPDTHSLRSSARWVETAVRSLRRRTADRSECVSGITAFGE